MLLDVSRRSRVGNAIALRSLDLRGVHFTGTTSYVVHPRALDRLEASLAAALREGPQIAVDHHIRRECAAGRLRAGCILPFFTSIDLEVESTIGDRGAGRFSFLLLRHAFFVEADLNKAEGLLHDIVAAKAPPGADRQLDLVGEIVRFSLSSNFEAV
jgi:hypothetical protein